VRRLGFTHVEFMPLAEHPFTGSWGYQVGAYFAPTARYGTPDDLRFLIDACHGAGIGVIMDWVPAHFPKDDFALRLFDGTALYEHQDPRRGEHPEWGTLIFNYGRREVRNFLIANALYWLREFHVDGLRVDAVASMLYLDYSRPAGQWVPNQYGGREDLDAVEFLKQLNATITEEQPGCFTVAEESTSWPRVTGPVSEGGLGFTFKWNMGWMHDTLDYFSKDPVHRRYHHERLTFGMMYEYSEHFIMPLSHDEVVHGKGTLLGKMPGDEWQRFANLRALFAYHYTRPGKPLLFMGSELGSYREWNHDSSLDWHLESRPLTSGLMRFLGDLGAVYRERSELWRGDPDLDGFRWLDADDRDRSVYAYMRRDGDQVMLVLLNLTPVPRPGYRAGAPLPGRYALVLSSDDSRYGGSGYGLDAELESEPVEWQHQPVSVRISLPPLGAVLLAHQPR
jgi:1,4-alpha-glucan branching enzyme